METFKFSHILSTPDNDDPVPTLEAQVKMLAKSVQVLAQKLDLDTGATDTDYDSILQATTL